MATTDHEIEIQKRLAEYSYELKIKYRQTNGLTKKAYMHLYNEGEITLSTVFENLYVAMCKRRGYNVSKVSEDARDFCEVANNGDMKIGVLKKDGKNRRYVISGVANKIGPIYFVGWNWIEDKPNFYKIPTEVHDNPKCGIKIMRHPETGAVTTGKYNLCEQKRFEDLIPD